jgi:methyltransferase (TIGR00027 family)
LKPSQPSRTAYRVALRRAAHQLLDVPPVLRDPLAFAILRPDDAAAVQADPERFERGPVASFLRAFLAVRSRFAEDQLAIGRAGGVGQYVLLGAGLDTSPYRDPTPALPLRVWEVDHPDTQAWKRGRLAAAGIPIPDNVTLVPVDFERDGLAEALERAGFDSGAGAHFSWLGVTPYLTADSIRATLRYVASVTAAGGGVVFDYALAREDLTLTQRQVYDAFAVRVAAAGEPWLSGFQPEVLARQLRELGFRVAQDVVPDTLNRTYLGGRKDGLSVGSLAHLMWAGTTPLPTQFPG